MRTVVLTEYVPSEPIALSVAQRDALGKLVKGLTITPAAGSTDTYTLTSSSTVGVARVGDLTLELRPKIGVAPVLFLISYALEPEVLEARTGAARPRRQPRRGRHPAVHPHRPADDPPRTAARLPPARRHADQRPGPRPHHRPVPRPNRPAAPGRSRLRRLHPGHPRKPASPHRRRHPRTALPAAPRLTHLARPAAPAAQRHQHPHPGQARRT